ncbi:MAG: hypothetical protein K0B09_08430, partial [Bacteroidales bacterium]|nr:hypothetical protein [Bacteroidales bacterium]
RIATFSKSLVLQKTGFFYGFIFTPVRVACPLASGSPPFLKAPFERLGLFYGLSSQRSEPTAISPASARQCLAPTGLIGGFVYAVSTNMAPLRGFFRFLASSPLLSTSRYLNCNLLPAPCAAQFFLRVSW